MERPRSNLSGDGYGENADKHRAAESISPVQRHGDGVAAGFSQGGRRNLDHPKSQGDFRNLAQAVFIFHRLPFQRVGPDARGGNRRIRPGSALLQGEAETTLLQLNKKLESNVALESGRSPCNVTHVLFAAIRNELRAPKLLHVDR